MNQYQQRYWKELFQLIVHVNYLEIYLEKSEFKDKAINIFLAITSNSSICGWIIWQTYSWLWAGIIAVSQLITAIKTFLPYKDRLKMVSSLLHEVDELLLYCEMKWFDVAEGKLTEEEINKLHFEIKRKKAQAVKKHLGGHVLPKHEEYFEKAKELANTYSDNFYSQKNRRKNV